MKTLFVALVLVASFSNTIAQQRISKKELSFFKNNLENNPLLKDDDPDFKTAAGGGSWKDESAVILCQKTTFDFDKKGVSVGKRIGRNIWGILFALPTFGLSLYGANARNETKIMVEETERRKILLKDKFALDLYSVLYFRLSTDGDAFDARVHKTDGSIQKISIEDAVKVENLRSVPEIFKTYTDDNFSSSYRPTYFKVVVPDLQEGDILEYGFVNYNAKNYMHNPNFKEFQPVYYLCNRSMPVDKQIIEVVMQDDKYHLGYKSIQGAPDFKRASSNKKEIYRWEDSHRDKMADVRYVNKYLEMPSVKFQVIYAKKSSNEYMFVNDQKDMKKELSEKEFSEKAKMFWFASAGSSGPAEYKSDFDDEVKDLHKTLKKRNVTEDSDDEYVRKAYYTIRGKTLYANWTDYAFAKIFAGLLDKKKIPYEIVATSSNTLTGINNLAFVKEILWAVKYKGRYYSNPHDHLNPGEVPAWLSGNKVVVFADDEKSAVTTENIPPSDTASNQLQHIVKATLNLEKQELSVDQNVQGLGLAKANVIDDILALTPFMENDYKNFDGEGMFEAMSTKDRTTAEDEFNTQKKEWKEEKPKMMKAMIEDEFNKEVVGDVAFKLVNDGRNFKKQALVYNQKFTLANMSAKAGDDIVLSLPALLGGQSQIRKEERNRKTAANVGYPRSLQWVINFTIPAGYTVQGIDKMNQDIQNEAGAFTSRATIEGQELVLRVKKSYNTRYLALAKWPLLVKVLDAAYNYSQQKIVLKKS
jgi:hypothetical protein